MTILICTLTILLTVGVHYECLLFVSKLLKKDYIPPRPKVALSILLSIVAHLLEIHIFAMVFYFFSAEGMGPLSAALPFTDFVYFSIVNYTSLGYGDMIPQGPLRMLAGLEALLGLVLITWTASFTFIQMKKYWID